MSKLKTFADYKISVFFFFCRNRKITGNAQIRTAEMTAEEVIVRLKDRMSQHSQQFRQAFLSYDRRGKGLISKKDFRQVKNIVNSFPNKPWFLRVCSTSHLKTL